MPSYSSQTVVIGRAWLDDVIAALGVDPGAALLVTPKVRLSKSEAFNPTSLSTRAALVAGEADFSGYTAGGYTFVPVGPAVLGSNARGLVGNILAVATDVDPFVPNQIYGYWIDNGVDVVIAERFPEEEPFSFTQAGDYLDLLARVPFALAVAVA